MKIRNSQQVNLAPAPQTLAAPRPAPALWFTLGQLALGLALLLALGYYFGPVAADLVTEMAGSDNYSSGLLIPFIIGFIVYRKWPALRQPWQPSWWGLAVLALGFGLYFLGAVLTIEYISRQALVVILAGVLWLLGGWRLVRRMAFPLLLLALVVPLPQMVLSRLTLRLQIASSQLAADMLRLLGYPVALSGNVIDLGDRQLQVVAACSGLGYLFNALGLGIIFCYFFQRRAWKVALLLLAMIPFAVVANAVRLASIGIWPIFEKGLWHASFGLSIFIVGFDYLRGINWLMNYAQPVSKAADQGQRDKAASEPAVPARAKSLSFYPYLAAGLLLVLAAGPWAVAGVEAVPVPLKQSFDQFPLQLGPWEGRQLKIDPEILAATGADTALSAQYSNPGQGPVDLWIAYYENQKSGASVHSPMTCLTGGGWKTIHSEVFMLTPGKPINYVILEQAGKRTAMYYWYFERGRWLASDYGHKLGIGWDRLMSKRADGALVRLTTAVSGGEDKARERLDGFLGQLGPVLGGFIRDKENL